MHSLLPIHAGNLIAADWHAGCRTRRVLAQFHAAVAIASAGSTGSGKTVIARDGQVVRVDESAGNI
jgi:hypothetical protein